jgi:hypothetical protein
MSSMDKIIYIFEKVIEFQIHLMVKANRSYVINRG